MKILSSSDAGLIINAAINSHYEYWEAIKTQEDHILNGKKPYDFKDLEEKGIGWCNNRNYGQGRAVTEQAVIDSSTNILKSLSLLEIDFKTFNEKTDTKDSINYFLLDENLKDIIQEKLAYVFQKVLLSTEKIKTFITQIELNSYLHGYCPITRDMFGWLGKPNHVTHIAFEDRTPVGDIKTFVCFDVVKSDVLLQKLQSLENLNPSLFRDQDGGYAIYDNFWIKKGLEEALSFQLNEMNLKDNQGSVRKFTGWDNIKELIEERGYTWFCKNVNNIFIAKIFTKEEDGSFTETYVRTTMPVEKSTPYCYGVGKYLLFQKSHKNKKITDFINLVKEYSVSTTEYIQDLRGCGKELAEYSLSYDIKKNAVEDKLLLSGGLILTAQTSLSKENVALQVIGGMVILPEGVAFAPNQQKIDLGDHIQSINEDKQEYQDQSFHYNPKPELTSRPTKDEVQLVSSRLNQQAQNKLPFKLLDYSKILTFAFKDLLNNNFIEHSEKELQELFFNKLTEEFAEFSVSLSDIKKICKLVENISIFPVLQNVQAIKEALAIAPNPMARKKLLKMLFLAYGFSRRDINVLIQEENYGNQLELASTENANFYNTSEIIFTLGQDHITHLNMHFGKADRVFQNIKAGDDPVKGYNYINNLLINTQQHVAALEKNPFFSNKFKEFLKIQKFLEKEHKSLGDEIKKLQQQIQQQKENQQNQQNLSLPPEVQQKMYLERVKALDKIKRTNLQAEANQERRRKEFDFKQELEKQKTENEINIQKELADVKKELELLKQSTKLAK